MIQAPMFRTEPTDAEMAARWAADVAADPAAVFLDTETTGLGDDAEICDIALVGADGRVLLDTLVRPLRPIPAAAPAVHGIAEADVAAAPRWSELVPEVAALLRGRRVVVYNAAYDAEVVNGVCRPLGLELARGWECAMQAYGAYHGAKGPKGGYRWHKLDAAAAAFGIPPGGHRALADAEVCRRVVLAMAGRP